MRKKLLATTLSSIAGHLVLTASSCCVLEALFVSNHQLIFSHSCGYVLNFLSTVAAAETET